MTSLFSPTAFVRVAKHGVFKYRRGITTALQPSAGRSEVVLSLDTRDPHEAALREFVELGGLVAYATDADFEREHSKPQQDARFEADVWEEKIAEYLSLQNKVTVGDVTTGALGFETAKIGRADQNRIVAAMERLGWERLNNGKADWQGKRWWVKA